ncbi:MAG: preprotein translocase subunit SecE [Candidatus Kapabacteria bacterium]|jgi:preprotein translocase subunit SecE|nr:preprotein translocase subunit SecE [Candidatus Kapabacteria bacterium]
MITSIKEFSNDVVKEMKKVSWPNKEQLKESTVVVLTTCVVISVFVWFIDTGMTFIIKTIF